MSDIYLTLKVKRSDQGIVNSLIQDAECSDKLSAVISVDGITEFTFCELKFEDLEIESELQNKRIPYDKIWDESMELPAGSEYFRLNEDGTKNRKRFTNDTKDMIYLDDLIKSFELNRVESFINEMKNELRPTPLACL